MDVPAKSQYMAAGDSEAATELVVPSTGAIRFTTLTPLISS
jgi:hypothetical protein